MLYLNNLSKGAVSFLVYLYKSYELTGKNDFERTDFIGLQELGSPNLESLEIWIDELENNSLIEVSSYISENFYISDTTLIEIKSMLKNKK